MPAVSVRNLLVPKLTALNWFCKANSISFGLKSPSGPIKIKVFSALLTVFNSFFSPSSQCAIYLAPLRSCFIKLVKEIASLSFGK